MIDSVDREIVAILQDNARTTNTEIGRRLELAPSGILERIRKLEKRGLITGYHASLNARQLGFGMTAFLFVQTEDRVGDTTTARRLGQIAEVEEVHHISGEDCYLVKVRCADHDDLGRILKEQIGAIRSVKSSRTCIVMETIKEGGLLPIRR